MGINYCLLFLTCVQLWSCLLLKKINPSIQNHVSTQIGEISFTGYWIQKKYNIPIKITLNFNSKRNNNLDIDRNISSGELLPETKNH